MCYLLPYRISPLAGICIGEALQPGPPQGAEECRGSCERALAALELLGLSDARAARDVASAPVQDVAGAPECEPGPIAGEPAVLGPSANQGDDFGSCFGDTFLRHNGDIDEHPHEADREESASEEELSAITFESLLPGFCS